MTKKKIALITLGCSKNLVDSEDLATRLSEKYEIVYDNGENADVVIVNTCGFILDAQQESIDTILFYANEKLSGKIKKLFVFGCLSERFKKDLKKEIPECDEFFGVDSLKEILDVLDCEEIEGVKARKISTLPHTAYIKAAEGCNRQCSFCIIPSIRGRFVSKKIEDIVEEVRLLSENGVREFNIVAQDLSYYGKDLYGRYALPELLEKLTELPEVHWIRLHYTYPNNFPLKVLEIMGKSPKICRYLDIPIQHASDKILEKMKRGHSKSETAALIAKFREIVPDIALRTTLMVGFPSETDKDFAELEEFVKEARFDRLGVFQYSPEEGTFSQKNFRDDVSKKKKQERADRIMKIQQKISLETNLAKVGKTFEVLIDRVEGEYFTGRTMYDSPEVDCEVLVKISDAPHFKTGCFYDVRITGAEEFDLYGVPSAKNEQNE